MKTRIVFFILWLCPSAVFTQGYRMEGDRIVVEGNDWLQWDYPQNVLERDEEGGLKSRFVPKHINACLDADQFFQHKGYGGIRDVQGGAKGAGSNLAEVVNVMDGDPLTFWEPDLDAPLEDWWLELDLGRCVLASEVVLRFVEEGMGDPFLHFCERRDNRVGWGSAVEHDYASVSMGTSGRSIQIGSSRFRIYKAHLPL